MAQTVIADVSQWQGKVDWAAYAAGGYQAAIARLSYGVSLIDPQAIANLTGMRARLGCRGWYHYLTAGDDPTAQAHFFCSILKQLLAGEFIVVDEEEGEGDQEPRAATFLAVCNQLLGLATSQDVEYSGLNFVAAHGGWVPGVTRWVAAYQPNDPQAGQALWQCTDSRLFPGIADPCDASIFNGTIDQLVALVTPNVPQPPEEPMPYRVYAIQSQPSGKWHIFNLDLGWRIPLQAANDGSAVTDAPLAGMGLPTITDKFSDAEMEVIPVRTGSVA